MMLVLSECLLLVTAILVDLNNARTIPDDIPVCHRSDPDFSGCLKNAIDMLRPHMLTGIPELRLPPVDPMVIPELSVDRRLDNIAMKARISNINVIGGSRFNVDDIKADFNKNEGEIQITIPKMQVTCDYDVNGRVLMLSMNGKGKMTGEFKDTTVIVNLGMKEVKRNGVDYYEIDRINTKVNVGNGRLKLMDSRPNYQLTADAAMNFFNTNSRQALDNMSPLVDDTASQVIYSMLNRALELVPAEELFPK